MLLARFSLRRSWLSTLAFAGALALFQATLIWGYQFIGGAATVQSVVGTLSPELRRALKIMPSLQGGFGPREYVALGLYHPIYLGLGAAYAVSRAADALAGGVERGTVLLILARPISRTQLVLGEALGLALGLALVSGAGLAGLLAGLASTGFGRALAWWPYALAAAVGWLLFVALGMIALLAAATQTRSSSAAGLGSAVVLGGFVLDLLPWTGAAPLALLNPWHWYDPPRIISAGVGWYELAALLGLGGAALLATLHVWGRKRLI
jgi:ABC-2 type transport system permease protein